MFNEEMTSKMQGTVNREDLGTRLSCFGCEKKMADISLVSRVRTTARTRRNNVSLGGKSCFSHTNPSNIIFDSIAIPSFETYG